ncbi:MAG: hypothetical protein KatS3mg087_1143 [Patescibacteria group bacterium]|nr:MAG: hypothetical protein KatS3mg087_1143 [Patescibacteria group bacterium]
MSILVLFLLFNYIESAPPPNTVNILELNHVYGYDELLNAHRETLVQWIGWIYYPDGQFHVAWWTMYDKEQFMRLPNGKVMIYIKGRKIIADHFIETFSNYDREIADREHFPTYLRKGLYDYNIPENFLKGESLPSLSSY